MRSPRGSNEFGPLLPRPRADDVVGHGYTAFQVVRLAVWAARECRWVNGMDMVHRAETAWEAITEHLQLVTARPQETDLIAIGWKAMKAQHYQDLKAHGLGGKDKALVSRAFLRYWTSTSAPAHSHEDLLVDRIALVQIWAALTPTHRQVLTALAEHDDRRRAERAVNMDTAAFTRTLGRARRAFFALWHEGETPSKMWGYDRPGARHQNVMYLVRLRKQRALKRKAAGMVPHQGHRPPKELGVPNSELLARFEGGETYASLARELSVNADLIRARVNKARTEKGLSSGNRAISVLG
ncbi:hypothetical protein [Nocardiopsis valliformis]|uniref:hypothetical protein n=1 Tax=Nocardiopsis valliformis TaxID=239974 RepID=UPI001EF9D7D6|nr:hypothetical protein [Nocardiopsis valliformis]